MRIGRRTAIRSSTSGGTLVAVLGAALLAGSSVAAAPAKKSARSTVSSQLAEQKRRIADQERRIDEQQRLIHAQQAALDSSAAIADSQAVVVAAQSARLGRLDTELIDLKKRLEALESQASFPRLGGQPRGSHQEGRGRDAEIARAPARHRVRR
jgi:hypothetical protein